MTLVDTHCHLDDKQFDDDREAVIGRALDAGVARMLTIGTGEGPPDLEAALHLADRFTEVYASAGIHPEHATKARDADYQRLRELLRHPKCVAVGEIGLDYYWKPFDQERQVDAFRTQLQIAAEARKPVVIRTRDAWDDTMALLREQWTAVSLPCIMHCFTGTPEQAGEALRLGFYISLSGVVTYPKAVDVHRSAQIVPRERLLVETDAPYLAPVPYRGKRNEPLYVQHTLARVAELRQEPVGELAEAVVSNFDRILGDQLH